MSSDEDEEIQQEEELREELLQACNPPSPKAVPKPNTKQSIIDRIQEISISETGSCEYSQSKLKRMSKKQLSELLADKIEEGMRRKMARSVGVDQDGDERTIALGALRMFHDLCANATERGGNMVLKPRGYQLTGFANSLKEPTVSKAIDDCLQEIADENSEILGYVQSPYSRLGLAWAGAICFSMKKVNNATNLEPRPAQGKNPFRGGSYRRTTSRQEYAPAPPVGTNAHTV